MSERRAKSTGCTAFGLQQTQNGVFQAQASNKSLSALTSSMTSETLLRSKHLPVKPFSSVKLPYVDYPPTSGSKKQSKPSKVGSCASFGSKKVSWENKHGQVLRQLKAQCSCADDSLIKDIMAVTGNDFDKASSFLKAMSSELRLKKNKCCKAVKSSCCAVEPWKNDNDKPNLFLGNVSELLNTCLVLDSCVADNGSNVRDKFCCRAYKLVDDCMNNSVMLGQLTCIPILPKREEDDVYLSCRKDAIKMISAASQHSKAATESYQRGDHISAQQYSQKAREEWTAVKKLNSKASGEILRTRNQTNGMWKLDLHGLHVAEAINALKERLLIIETQAVSKGSSPWIIPSSFRPKAEGSHASLGGRSNIVRSDEVAILRQNQNPIWLEVITGIGNHSRGVAVLPTAVRAFLADSGYRFVEARPGVIMVWPKICQA